MPREFIRVESLSTYLEKWKAPTSAVIRAGDMLYVSGFGPFDRFTGQVLGDPPARVFVTVPAWPGPFDIEIDCVAAV
jgi:2-iminobutanoate/2-iminopropanoate deaminase